MFGWLLFRSMNLTHAVELLSALDGDEGFGFSPIVQASLTPQRLFWMCLGVIVFFLPSEKSFGEALNDSLTRFKLSLVAISAGTIASVYVLSSSFSPFLYFQF